MIVNELSFDLVSGSSCNMGEKYMARISKANAKAFCGMYPLPRMGSEITVAVKPDPAYPSFRLRLCVQNISGAFYLASSDTSKEYWGDMFNVHLAK